ncbi:hypothetical protein ACHAWC_001514, partial [Mediolabrus comicus]
MSGKKKSASTASPPEVPIFLQKTYHMIDTCDPQIATWSPHDNGETFIVTNVKAFESTIIPQFFKHSKFSSFVRQLNFYGFRKIRYADKVSLKIDPVAEKEQSKYWRFKHENFKKGRMDLLIEIKRHASNSNSSSSSSSNSSSNNGGGTTAGGGAGPTPNAVVSNSNMTMMAPPMATSSTTSSTSTTTINTMPPHHQQQKDVSRLNTEVKSLKKQMSSMAKNMEDLTSLVKGMNVSSEGEGEEGDFSGGFGVGNKRKKISLSPEVVPSSSSFGGMVNEEEDVVMMSSFPSVDDTLLEDSAAADLLLPDLTPSSSLLPSTYSSPVLSRSSSLNGVSAAAAASGGGGGDFVDELFHAFATEEEGQPSSQQQPQQLQEVVMMENPNKPDAALMKRIEDSLSTIPKTMHEMVANRLIDAIAEGNKDISACSSSS